MYKIINFGAMDFRELKATKCNIPKAKSDASLFYKQLFGSGYRSKGVVENTVSTVLKALWAWDVH